MIKPIEHNVTVSGILGMRKELTLQYLLSLKDSNLLISYYQEAGLNGYTYLPYDKHELHNGWDSPLSQIRGTFTGHWLSAAAQIIVQTDSSVNTTILKARADFIVSEIARCQIENGGEWCFPIPEKYLLWLKKGKRTWAPHYVCHKVMMGLLDMYIFTGNKQALDIVKKAADWFYKYSLDITDEQMRTMMHEETGGIMELWADLYAITDDPNHKFLMERYERCDLTEALLRGEDCLSNMHMNTTVPEILGVAKAYEVTGNERYLNAVKKYWDVGIETIGTFATGGSSSGEVFTSPNRQESRLGMLNQEHCVVYNIMRLADFLFRQTGQSSYLDLWERNFYNGILAQGFAPHNYIQQAGGGDRDMDRLVAYYLPLEAGAKKVWGSATGDFWCCHCTLVQANVNLFRSLYYIQENTVYLAQFHESEVNIIFGDQKYVNIKQEFPCVDIIDIKRQQKLTGTPGFVEQNITVTCANSFFTLAVRLPNWLDGKATITADGVAVPYTEKDGFALITIENTVTLTVILPKKRTVIPLADRANTVAFADGPVILAALSPHDQKLYYKNDPWEILVPHDELHWSTWNGSYKTINQSHNLVFVPLYKISDERYTTYFELTSE